MELQMGVSVVELEGAAFVSQLGLISYMWKELGKLNIFESIFMHYFQELLIIAYLFVGV